MQLRRWWIPVVFVAGFAFVGWLSVVAPSFVTVLVGVGWLAIGVGFAVRIARARQHRLRTGLAPAGDAAEIVQGMYLGRPDVEVVYGDDTPDPDLTLYVDDPEQDPGDLRGDAPAERTSV